MFVLKKTYDAMERDRDDWRDKSMDQSVEMFDLVEKFKKAVADLAEQSEELNDAKWHIDHLGVTFNQRLADAVQDYAADALKWRASLKRSRDRKAAKREGSDDIIDQFINEMKAPIRRNTRSAG